MCTEPSTENPPPCAHCVIARAASSGSRPRRTKARNSRRRTHSCTAAMALASSPVAAWKMTLPAATESNPPSMTTQWKCRWGLRVEPKDTPAVGLPLPQPLPYRRDAAVQHREARAQEDRRRTLWVARHLRS